MKLFLALFKRAQNSAVIWSWGFNGLRLASGLLLLPLLASKLGKPEFGMYYVLLSIAALLSFLDFGLLSSISRFVAYANAGATKLQAQGLPPPQAASGPNLTLLWQLLRSTRVIYGFIALFGFIVMGVWGTLIVQSKAAETTNPSVTWFAWWLTLLAATLELYSSWWNTFLYCLNRVQESAQINFAAYMLRLVLACGLLLAGAGLMSVPAASFVGSLFVRVVSRRAVLRSLGPTPTNSENFPIPPLLKLFWPNSWRLALQVLSNYLRTNATVQICVVYFGLTAAGEYGLSLQVMNIAVGMSAVWTAVKWPQVMQLRSAHDFAGLRKLLWPRAWLQVITFVLLSGIAIAVGPTLLRLVGTDKQLLPGLWVVTMAFTSMFDLTYVFWATLLAAENRVPTLWSTVAANVGTLLFALLLSRYTSLGVASLIIAPLISGGVFIYWYWPRAGARSLGTTWSGFMFNRS